MAHGTEPSQPADNTHPYGTPEGDIVVFAGNSAPRHPAPLDSLTNGTSVIAAGMVDGIQMHGTPDAPLATFVLINPVGQAAYAAVDTQTYDEVFGYLLENHQVSLHGVCRRVEGLPPYIQVTRVDPLH